MDSGLGFGGNTSRAELEVLLKLRDTGVAAGIEGVNTRFSQLQVNAAKLDFSGALERTRASLARNVIQTARLNTSMVAGYAAAKLHADAQLKLSRHVDAASSSVGGLRGRLDGLATTAQGVGKGFVATANAVDTLHRSTMTLGQTLRLVRNNASETEESLFQTQRAFIANANGAIEAARAISATTTAWQVWRTEAATASDKAYATGDAMHHIGKATISSTGAVLASAKVHSGFASAVAKAGQVTGAAASHFLLGGAAILTTGTAMKRATAEIEAGRAPLAAIGSAFLSVTRAILETAAVLSGPWGAAAVAAIHVFGAIKDGVKGMVNLIVKAHVEVGKFAWRLVTDFGSIRDPIAKVFHGIKATFEDFHGLLEKLSWFDPTAIVEGGLLVGATMRKMSDAAHTAWRGFKTLTGGFAALAWEAKSTDSIFNAFTLSSERLGLEGEALIKTLSRESLGLVSQAEAMEKINTATALIGTSALKQVGSVDQVFADMIKTSMAAARSTGQSVEYMFNSIIMGIGRASPMILDNLGMSLKLGDVYERAAKKMGKATTALTLTERKVALMNEVLAKGRDLVDQYGISTGGVGTQAQKIGVALKDLAFRLGETFMPVLKDFMTTISFGVGSLTKTIKPMTAFWGVFKALPPAIRDTMVGMSSLGLVTSILSSGPGAQLLNVLGVSQERFQSLTKWAGRFGVAIIGLTSAYHTNFLGLQDLLKPLVKFPEMVADALADADMNNVTSRFQSLIRSSFKLEGDTTAGPLVTGIIDDVKKALGGAEGRGLGEALGDLFKMPAGAKNESLDISKLSGLGPEQVEALKSRVASLRTAMSEMSGLRKVFAFGGDAKATEQLETRLRLLDERLDPLNADLRTTSIEVNELRRNNSGLSDSATAVAQAINGLRLNALGPLAEVLGAGREALYSFASSFFSPDFEKNLGTFQASLAHLREWIPNLVAGIGQSLGLASETVGEGVGGFVRAIITRIGEIFTTILPEALNFGAWLMQYFGEGLSAAYSWIEERITGLGGEIGRWLTGSLEGSRGAVGAALGNFIAGWVGMLSTAMDGAIGLMSQLWIEITNLAASAGPSLLNTISDIVLSIAQRAPAALNKITDLIVLAVNEMVRAIANLFGISTKETEKVVNEEMRQAGEKMRQAMTLVWGSLKNAWKRLKDKFAENADTWGPVFSRLGSALMKAYLKIYPILVKIGVGIAMVILHILRGVIHELGERLDLEGAFWRWLLPFDGMMLKLAEKFKVSDNPVIRRVGEFIAKLLDTLTHPFRSARDLFSIKWKGEGVGGKLQLIPGSGSSGEVFGPPSPPNGWTMPKVHTPTGAGGGIDFGAAGEGILSGIGASIKKAFAGPDVGGAGALAGGGGDESADAGKGGKGAGGDKDGKGGGEATKRDPLKEAMEAISSVSGAIKTGIDAAKAVWTDFMGAPADAQLDKLFLWLDDLLDRALKLADNALTVEEADGIQRAMGALTETFSSMTGAVEMSSTLLRMRTPSESAVTKVFEFMGMIVKAATESIEGLDLDNLMDSVKQTTFMQEMGTIVNSWAESLTKIAEASNAVASGRMDADFAPVFDVAEYVFHRAARLVNTMAASESETRPFALVDQQMRSTGESVGIWAGTLASIADLITKANVTRVGGSLDGLMNAAMTVMNIGAAIATAWQSGHGDYWMLAAEDAQIIGDGLSSWVGMLSGIADVVQSAYGVHSEATFSRVGDWLLMAVDAIRTAAGGILEAHGSGILRLAADLQAVGDALGPWAGLLTSVSDLAEKMVTVRRYGSLGLQPVRELFSGVIALINDVAGEQWGRVDASGHFDLVAQDIRTLGESMSSWAPSFEIVDKVLATIANLRVFKTGGGVVSFDTIRAVFASIGTMVWGLYQDVTKSGLGDKRLQEIWVVTSSMAAALGAWVEPLSRIGEAMMSMRRAMGAGDIQHEVGLVISYLRLIGERTWISFGEAMGNVDAEFTMGVSTSIATTLGAWVDLLTKFEALSLALRRVRVEGLQDSGKLSAVWSTLTWLGGRSWNDFVLGAMGGGVDAQTISQAVAGTLGAWVDLATKMGDLSRQLLRVREVPDTAFDVVDTIFERLWGAMQSFYDRVKNDPDPAERPTIMAVVAGALGGMVDSVSKVADLSRGLVGFIRPLPGEWAAIKEALNTVWSSFLDVAKGAIADPLDWDDEVAPRIRAWQEAVGGLTSAVSAVAGIQLHTYVKPLAAEFSAVKESLTTLWDTFKSIADTAMPADPDDAALLSNRVNAWSTVIQSLATAVGSVGGLNVIEHIGVAPGMMERIKTTILSLFSTFEEIGAFWAASHRRPDLQATSIQQWSQTVGSILSAVSGTFELLKNTTGIMPSRMPSALVSRLRTTMVAFLVEFEELWTGEEWSRFAFPEGERGIQDRDRHHGSIRTFADAVGGVMGSVKNTIDTLVAFTDSAGKLGQVSATAQGAIRGATTILFGMFEDMAHQWRAGTIVGDQNLAAVKTFADSVNSIFAPVKGVIDTLASIDDLLWETLDAGNDADTAARLGKRVAGGKGSVTASGKFRFRRVIEVTGANIAWLTGFVNVMFTELQTAMATLKNAFQSANPEKDWAIHLAELKAFLETVGSGMGVFKSINDLIIGLMENPLSVMAFGGRAGNQRAVSKWWTQVRTNRADAQATLLKEAIKRNIGVIVDAVREAFSGETTMPDIEQINIMERLASVLSGLITAVGSIAMTPDLDKAKVDALVACMRQLSEISVPDWLRAGGLSGESVAAFRSLLDALASAKAESIDAVVSAVARLGGEAARAAMSGMFVVAGKDGTITIGAIGAPAIPPPGITPPPARMSLPGGEELSLPGGEELSLPGGEELAGAIIRAIAKAVVTSLPGGEELSLPGGEELAGAIVRAIARAVVTSLPGGEEGRMSLPGGEEGRMSLPGGEELRIGPIIGSIVEALHKAVTASLPGGEELLHAKLNSPTGGLLEAFGGAGAAELFHAKLNSPTGGLLETLAGPGASDTFMSRFAEITAPNIDVQVDVQPQVNFDAQLVLPNGAIGMIADLISIEQTPAPTAGSAGSVTRRVRGSGYDSGPRGQRTRQTRGWRKVR